MDTLESFALRGRALVDIFKSFALRGRAFVDTLESAAFGGRAFVDALGKLWGRLGKPWGRRGKPGGALNFSSKFKSLGQAALALAGWTGPTDWMGGFATVPMVPPTTYVRTYVRR